MSDPVVKYSPLSVSLDIDMSKSHSAIDTPTTVDTAPLLSLFASALHHIRRFSRWAREPYFETE